MNIVYITEMLRWGDTESHHYIVGVYSSLKAAELAGQVEESWRGGKYSYVVNEFHIDEPIPEEQLSYHQSTF